MKYPHDTSWTVERDEFSADVLVEYTVDQYASEPSGQYNCPPENYDPGSGWVFCINPRAFVNETENLELTEAEIDKIHDWLSENPPEDDYYDDY